MSVEVAIRRIGSCTWIACPGCGKAYATRCPSPVTLGQYVPLELDPALGRLSERLLRHMVEEHDYR